jgi:hypothetical protein
MRSFKIEETGYGLDLGLLVMCCTKCILNILGEVGANLIVLGPLILPKNHDMNLEPKPICTTITRVGDFECISYICGPYVDTFLDWTPTLEWHMEHL